MATRQITELAAIHAAAAPRTRSPRPSAPRNRVVAFLATIVDVFREARELEIRMLSQGAYRRFGES